MPLLKIDKLSEQFQERIDFIDRYINDLQVQLNKGTMIGLNTYAKLNQRKKKLVLLNQLFKDFKNNLSIIDQLPKTNETALITYIKQMTSQNKKQ